MSGLYPSRWVDRRLSTGAEDPRYPRGRGAGRSFRSTNSRVTRTLHLDSQQHPNLSRKFRYRNLFKGTILEPSTSHIGREVALVAWAAALVYKYIYAGIAEMITHFTHHFLDKMTCLRKCKCSAPSLPTDFYSLDAYFLAARSCCS